MNLHLLGFGIKRQPAAQLWHDTWPWLLGSLTVMLISGMLLFTSEATKLYYHEAFWVKMTLVAVGHDLHIHGHAQGCVSRSGPRAASVGQGGGCDIDSLVVDGRRLRKVDRLLVSFSRHRAVRRARCYSDFCLLTTDSLTSTRPCRCWRCKRLLILPRFRFLLARSAQDVRQRIVAFMASIFVNRAPRRQKRIPNRPRPAKRRRIFDRGPV